jgi:hypothetical protein
VKQCRNDNGEITKAETSFKTFPLMLLSRYNGVCKASDHFASASLEGLGKHDELQYRAFAGANSLAIFN